MNANTEPSSAQIEDEAKPEVVMAEFSDSAFGKTDGGGFMVHSEGRVIGLKVARDGKVSCAVSSSASS